jgi:hypothetical protein
MSGVLGGNNDGSSVENVPTLTGEQSDLLKSLNDLLGGQLGQGVTPYQGTRVAPLSSLQTMGLGMAGGLGGGLGSGIDMFSQGMKGLGDISGMAPQFLRQAEGLLGKATQNFDPSQIMNALKPGFDLAQNVFQNDTTPFLQERLGATSKSSGSLNKALAEAGGNMSLGMSAQAAPYLASGYENQLNRQMQGAGVASGMAGMPADLMNSMGSFGSGLLGNLSGMANMGGMEQNYNQQVAAAEQAKFNEGQGFNNPWLNFLSPALNTSAFTPVVTPQGPSLVQSLLPALGSFAGSDSGSSMISGILGRLM